MSGGNGIKNQSDGQRFSVEEIKQCVVTYLCCAITCFIKEFMVLILIVLFHPVLTL
jgi:hypothetical protein